MKTVTKSRRRSPAVSPRTAEVRRNEVQGVPRKERASAEGLTAANVEAWLDAHGIRKVKVGAIDVDGVWRGKYVSREKFASAVKGGLGFCDVVFGWDLADALYDNAQVTGWHTGYPDAQATVDVGTGRVIPWEPDTAAFLLDFVNKDGSPFEPSPRQLLHKVGRRARELGFLPRFGAEYEYFIFRETPESLREKHFHALTPLSPGMFGYSWLRSSEHAELVHALVDGCNAFGIEVEGMHTETGPGVYETAIRYGDLEEAADRAALFKTVVKEICARQGLTACFMSKVRQDLPGCSGHVHQSLWSIAKDANAFHDPKAPHQMSRTMRHYLGGLVDLMPELTALYWPTVNSYKRSVENTWAPTTATWGVENRTCAVRVIGDSAKSMRVEYRQLGADMNAYVGMAASLAAGLYGIENELEPPAPCEGNGYQAAARPLPRSLKEAVDLLDDSPKARALLGDGFVDHYVRTRRWEVRQYERAVTDWELERYFELV